jgi:hypothetical protein
VDPRGDGSEQIDSYPDYLLQARYPPHLPAAAVRSSCLRLLPVSPLFLPKSATRKIGDRQDSSTRDAFTERARRSSGDPLARGNDG